MPEPSPLQIGQQINSYRVTRELDRGGMGVVYEAVQVQIGKRIAIKVLTRERAALPRHRERFLLEAQTCSRIQHDGLVQIFDFGQLPDGTPFIVMELLEGVSLRARLRQVTTGRMPWQEVLRFGQQLAAALAAAHAHGIVHRDLKPENVMLVPDSALAAGERCKLVDFGVARILERAEEPESLEPLATKGTAERLYSVGLGTPIYQAPEHFQEGAVIDGRSDVYSLGIVLYELLTGSPPFLPGASSLKVLHVYQPPRPFEPVVPPIPKEVEALVFELLAKHPAMRPTMAEVERRCSELLSEAEAVPPSRTRWTRWALAAIAAALVALLGALGMVLYNVRNRGMARLSGGKFHMGSTPQEAAEGAAYALEAGCVVCIKHDIFARELPLREVALRPFFLDVAEVTNEQLAAWLNGLRPPPEVSGPEPRVWLNGQLIVDLDARTERIGIFIANRQFKVREYMEKRPAVQVTWWGARAYCQAHGKDLPSEAQWEFAARGGAQQWPFPWGKPKPSCEGVAIGRHPNKPLCEQSEKRWSPVMTMLQDVTPEGIHDLGGNVAEWVLDVYVEHYVNCVPNCLDPVVQAPASPADRPLERVRRGGSWMMTFDACRGAGRGGDKPESTFADLGFRCAKSEDP